jgi:hypothetical protein
MVPSERLEENVEKKDSFFIHASYRSFCRIARKIAPKRKLSGKDFVKAESFGDRDKICRIFAAECYELAKQFAEKKKEKLSLQYAKLAARLLNLSLRPKRLQDLEEIKKVLAELKGEKAPGNE